MLHNCAEAPRRGAPKYAPFAKLLRFLPSLQHLTLSMCDCTRSSLRDLRAVPQLLSLDLWNVEVHEESNFDFFSPLTHLTRLCLSQLWADAPDYYPVMVLTVLSSCVALVELELVDIALDCESWEAAFAPLLPALRRFRCRLPVNNEVPGCQILLGLQGLRRASRLESIELSHLGTPNEGLLELARAPHLTRLVLSAPLMLDARPLARLTCLRKLTLLAYAPERQHFPLALTALAALTHLAIGGRYIESYNELSRIATALPLRALRVGLQLPSSSVLAVLQPLTRKEAYSLASAELQSLDIELRSNLTSTACAALLRLPSATRLQLRECAAGLKLQSLHAPSLRSLVLEGMMGEQILTHESLQPLSKLSFVQSIAVRRRPTAGHLCIADEFSLLSESFNCITANWHMINCNWHKAAQQGTCIAQAGLVTLCRSGAWSACALRTSSRLRVSQHCATWSSLPRKAMATSCARAPRS